MNKTRTIFVGAGSEGITTLEFLIDDPEIKLTAVVTQPDKPVGRKAILTPTPIKTTAEEARIKVYAPENNEAEYQKILDEEKPELIIVISYGGILPQSFISYPKYKSLNIHYSLLPLLRGAVPVQKAILEGHKQTGVSIQVMEYSLDEGPIVIQKATDIEPKDTTITLKEKLVFLGTDLLKKVLHPWIEGYITPAPQNNSKATYCYKSDISKENAEIKWQQMEPYHIDRMIRSFVPWPVAWSYLPSGKRLKIFEAEIIKVKEKEPTGKFFKIDSDIYVMSKRKGYALKLTKVQPEGKKEITGQEFAKGFRD